MNTAIPMHLWGKDHWTTLLYLEHCCTDREGRLDLRKMRCDPDRHPTLDRCPFPKKYPTRLRGGMLLQNHDDWDCVEDMVAAGLVEETPFRTVFHLTDLGWTIAGQLRRHRAEGNPTKDFIYVPD